MPSVSVITSPDQAASLDATETNASSPSSDASHLTASTLSSSPATPHGKDAVKSAADLSGKSTLKADGNNTATLATLPYDAAERSQNSSANAGLASSQPGSSSEPQYIHFDLDDPEDPFNWSKTRKWIQVLLCMFYTGATAVIATGYNGPLKQVTREFHISDTTYLSGNTCFLGAVAFAPLVLAPFSELVGRKNIVVWSSFIFAVTMIPQALAHNIETILISRIVQGAAGSVGNSITGGIVADLFVSHETSLPMSAGSLIIFLTRGVSPLCSAWSIYANYWRISFWWQFAVAFLSFLSLLFFRETRGSVILSRRAVKMTKECGGKIQYRCRADDEKDSYSKMLYISVSRPVLFLFTEPIVTAFSLWIGVLWGTVFLAIEAIPLSFTYAFGWGSEQGSLVSVTLALGGCCGWLLNLVQERWYNNAWEKHNGHPPPETRLHMSALGALMVPVGLLWFAWGCRIGGHPAVPIMGLTVFSTGVFSIYMAVSVYLSDLYKRYASSALAAQSTLRNLLAGIFILVAPQMYQTLSPHWGTTLIALICLILGSVPFILLSFGAKIRAKSKVAQALAKEEEEEEEWAAMERSKRDMKRRAESEGVASSSQDKPDLVGGELKEKASEPDLHTKNAVVGDVDLEKGL